MLVYPLEKLAKTELTKVGEKAVLLAWLAQHSTVGKQVPAGFVVDAFLYTNFIADNALSKKIKAQLALIARADQRTIATASQKIRAMFLKAKMTEASLVEVAAEVKKLLSLGPVMVRPSVVGHLAVVPADIFASVEIKQEKDVGSAIQQCFASLYSVPALTYFEAKTIDPRTLSLALIVEQKVVSSTTATVRTSDAVSGSTEIVTITFDQAEYVLAKGPALQGFASIIASQVTGKAPATTEQLLALVKSADQVERGRGKPVVVSALLRADGSWGLIGLREVTQTAAKPAIFKLSKVGKVLAEGVAVGTGIAEGEVTVVKSFTEEISLAGNILVARSPDALWENVIRQARGVILEDVVNPLVAALCREHNIPAVFGVKKATQLFKNNQKVTISCAEATSGVVYQGLLPYEMEQRSETNESTKTKLFLTVQRADTAHQLATYGSDGVGVLSEETIYRQVVGVHPLALTSFATLKNKKVKQAIADRVTAADKTTWAVDRLASAVGHVAAAFGKREVVFRFSAADSEEYASLVGGDIFEKQEKNPLIGWRGVARYVDSRFAPAFALTCRALKRARDEWGLRNLTLLVPFCRTIEEAKQLLEIVKQHGLERGVHGLKIYVMCEIPANVLLANEFAALFDGFSISLTNLAQLTLGADRSVFSSARYSEDDVAVKKLITEVIQVAKRNKKTVSLCETAALDDASFVSFLVEQGITSLSVKPDTFFRTRERVLATEKRLNSVPLTLPRLALSKSVSLAGVTGLSLMLTGFTCQTVDNRDVARKIESSVNEQIATVRNQVREEIQQQENEKRRKETRHYKEDSFATFDVQYPATWQVEHGVNQVKLMSPDAAAWLSVSKILVQDSLKVKNFTTSTWNGLYAETFETVLAENALPVKIMYVYPGPKNKSRSLIQFIGRPAEFDQIVPTVKDFKIE